VLGGDIHHSYLAAAEFPGGTPGPAPSWLGWPGYPQLSWRITEGPWFSNMLAILDFDGRRARVRFDRSTPDPAQSPHLVPVDETQLS
jgi:hypothetical protein